MLNLKAFALKYIDFVKQISYNRHEAAGYKIQKHAFKYEIGYKHEKAADTLK